MMSIMFTRQRLRHTATAASRNSPAMSFLIPVANMNSGMPCLCALLRPCAASYPAMVSSKEVVIWERGPPHTRSGQVRCGGGRCRLARREEGQADGKGAALPLNALDGNPAAVVLHDAPGTGEAQPAPRQSPD